MRCYILLVFNFISATPPSPPPLNIIFVKLYLSRPKLKKLSIAAPRKGNFFDIFREKEFFSRYPFLSVAH